MVEAQSGPDDVYDCIDRSDLVEMDIIRLAAVDPGLRLGQALENGQRRFPHRFRQRAAFDQHPYIGVVTMVVVMVVVVMVVYYLDVDLFGANAVVVDIGHTDVEPMQRELANGVFEPWHRHTEMNQGSQGHVTADA
jgi:hypothetical protein